MTVQLLRAFIRKCDGQHDRARAPRNYWQAAKAALVSDEVAILLHGLRAEVDV
jgi:hypothetical protein